MMMVLALGSGCSKEEEPSGPEFEGSILIQDFMIYVKPYAMHGIGIAKLNEEDFPKFISHEELDNCILFIGQYYTGQLTYWVHFLGCPNSTPWLLSADGELLDRGRSFPVTNHTKLTCIHIGNSYLNYYQYHE